MGEDEGAQQSHSIMDGSDGSASNECFKHHPDERTMSPGAPEFSKPDPDDEVETNPLLDDDLDPNKADEDDDDALAAGPPIDIFSMAYIGYLPQYFAVGVINQGLPSMIYGCLLYTSDAADEEDSVDLGGRRIIKKKKKQHKTEKHDN
eukprot:TRINITY_DN1970_c0_g1_i11.p1 TRINITY_DN1970_c0_g1~~TRINITY_DN1970_c0_g1_i11.p1  ORF type:complete len:148 (-),score=55.67 TRINITY_DN1970_c0_g1_i11:106-549(-)